MLIEEIKAHCQDAETRLERLYNFLKIADYKTEMAQIEKTMSQRITSSKRLKLLAKS